MVRNSRLAAEPARAGDRIRILATGLGAATQVLVRIGGAEVPAESVSAVAGRPGVSWISAIVPEGAPRGISVPLSIAAQLADGSSTRSNTVSLALEEQ